MTQASHARSPAPSRRRVGRSDARRLSQPQHRGAASKAIEPILPGTVLTAFFSASVSGTVHGSGGCNAYGASFVWMPVGSVNIYDLAHTDRHCTTPEGIMEQESTVVQPERIPKLRQRGLPGPRDLPRPPAKALPEVLRPGVHGLQDHPIPFAPHAHLALA